MALQNSMSSLLKMDKSGVVPMLLSTDSHMTHILDLGATEQNSHDVVIGHGITVSDIDGERNSVATEAPNGDFTVLFPPSISCPDNLLQPQACVKPDIALLQPVHVSSTVSTANSAATGIAFDNHTLLTTRDSPLGTRPSKSVARTQKRQTISCKSTSSFKTVLPKNVSGDERLIVCTELDKASSSESVSLNTAVGSASYPLVVKSDSVATTMPLVLNESGEGLDIESAASQKLEDSASSIFPEGAVLVETPQGLMLSIGDELRAVTLADAPDSQGNHLLSISNSCIPVALLSQCQPEGLMVEAEAGEAYGASGEGECDMGVEGTVICSSDLPLMTQQVLTVSTPEEEEPKKKNRGWPKGKKRKSPPEVTGPRAPMTGYVLFAINRRQEIKQSHPQLPFTEVTKVLGQEWSSMALDKKQKFLDEAENDKQRYIEELKQFKKSEMYQSMMKNKRTKDDDGYDLGDDMEDDGDELHCKVCKLYFSSLHNKKEHLLGRQHMQEITDQLKQEMRKQQREQEAADLGSESLLVVGGIEEGEEEGLTHAAPPLSVSPGLGEVPCQQCQCQAAGPVDVHAFIMDFISKNAEREHEIITLKRILHKHVQVNWNICKKIENLKDCESKLKQEEKSLRAESQYLSTQINTLKMVPALFGIEDL